MSFSRRLPRWRVFDAAILVAVAIVNRRWPVPAFMSCRRIITRSRVAVGHRMICAIRIPVGIAARVFARICAAKLSRVHIIPRSCIAVYRMITRIRIAIGIATRVRARIDAARLSRAHIIPRSRIAVYRMIARI